MTHFFSHSKTGDDTTIANNLLAVAKADTANATYDFNASKQQQKFTDAVYSALTNYRLAHTSPINQAIRALTTINGPQLAQQHLEEERTFTNAQQIVLETLTGFDQLSTINPTSRIHYLLAEFKKSENKALVSSMANRSPATTSQQSLQ